VVLGVALQKQTLQAFQCGNMLQWYIPGISLAGLNSCVFHKKSNLPPATWSGRSHIEIIWYTTCVHAGRCGMVHRAPLENMTYQKVWFLRHLCSLSPVHPSSHLFTCRGAANERQWPLRMSTEHGAKPSMIRSLRAHCWKCLSTAQPTSPKDLSTGTGNY